MSARHRLLRLEHAAAQHLANRPVEQTGDAIWSLVQRLDKIALNLAAATGPLPPIEHESPAGRCVRMALAAGEFGSVAYYRELRAQLTAFVEAERHRLQD